MIHYLDDYLDRIKLVKAAICLDEIIDSIESEMTLRSNLETILWKEILNDNPGHLIEGPDGRIYWLLTHDDKVKTKGIGELVENQGAVIL